MSGIHKRRGRVLVEFTEDTFDELGEPKRRTGEQVWVDPESAKSFVDIKGVAKRVEDEPEVAAAEVVEDDVEGQAPETSDTVTEVAKVEDEKPEKAPAKAAGKTAGKAAETPVTDVPPVGDA
ncbi:hypothetical protein [Mycolicibacterium fluoranthenivorans]|uniref:Uncharacterized protein n=1 Tax=Mycolicibacterium fluoranthenivorans TaxID=258505 RepID=A0A1G4VFD9_9MYCO|nr:hypothetical protein [Mycolicibacterium fluoranthenivorans]SCX05991.1 hypothetical protein SAMN02799620_00793 [Mycolicibacterium fluoranthenivorans]